jgi:hypothetical protein
MKTINIKGKEYVQVNERIGYFHSQKKYDKWGIETIKIKDEVCQTKKDRLVQFRAVIFDENKMIRATGHAEEYMGSSYINKTSFIENCETSAIGRALGLLGIGIDTSIASAEEVSNAISNQKEDSRPWLKETELKALLEKGTKKQAENVLAAYKMKNEYKDQITNKFKL